MATNAYNELQYLKNLYENSGSNKGQQNWAANQAKQYYSQLDQGEAKQIQGMNAQQLGAYLQNKNAPQQNTQQPQQFDSGAYMGQMQGYINDMFNQQRQAQLAQLQASRDKAIGQLNQQKANTAPQYQSMRNQTDATNLQNVQRLREVMANAGLTATGENVSANAAMNNQRVESLNSLNLQEQQTYDDIDRRIADLNNPAEENALIAALEAERSRALMDSYTRADEIAYGRGRDLISDSRWQQQFDNSNSQWQQQFDYQKQQDQAERAWREHTYNNMSASEKAQLEWAKSQYGEDAAWRMYQLQYQGELDKSMNQAQIDYYKNAGFNNEVKGDGWIPNTKDYKITSHYGGRNDPITGKPSSHRGMDLAVPKGTSLGSTVSGKVVSVNGHSSYGNTVVIQDENGNLHRFAHLDSIGVEVGQTVNRGSLIGKTGNTGRSTGAHLHYEVTNAKGALMNPSIFLK